VDNQTVICEMTSDSMYPFLQKGDFFVVKKVISQDEIDLGDCLLYASASNSKPVCHRLVKIKDGIFYLKGDSSIALDEPITLNKILGKVVAIKKHQQIFFLNGFWQKTRGRLTANLSLLSLHWVFLMRLSRLLFYPPQEIMARLRRKVWREA